MYQTLRTVEGAGAAAGLSLSCRLPEESWAQQALPILHTLLLLIFDKCVVIRIPESLFQVQVQSCKSFRIRIQVEIWPKKQGELKNKRLQDDLSSFYKITTMYVRVIKNDFEHFYKMSSENAVFYLKKDDFTSKKGQPKIDKRLE